MMTYCLWSTVLISLLRLNSGSVLTQVGRLYLPDEIGTDGTESIAVYPSKSRIFSANGATVAIDVIKFKATKKKIKKGNIPMKLINSIDVASAIHSSYNITAGSVTSIYYCDTTSVIISTVAPEKVAETFGYLVYIDPDDCEIIDILLLTDCYLPDHVTATSDCSKIIISCEGEPDDNEAEHPAINPPGSISIVDEDKNIYNAGFEEFNDGGSKALPDGIYQPHINESFSINAEPEQAAVDDDDKYAYVTLQENNAIGALDIANNEIIDIFALGLHNYSVSGLDASDKDNVINIDTYPNLYGLRMPDGIDFIQTETGKYIVTANEGDSKDFDESRVGDIELDVASFPSGVNVTELQMDHVLGRLKIINQIGINDEGLFEKLYSFNSRDFTIYEIVTDDDDVPIDIELIYSSLGDFERITADTVGVKGFNAHYYNPSFDARSDDKGPEPEHVVVGTLSCGNINKMYSFTVLERVGGIMVYDITDVDDVQFVQYINNRDYDIEYEEDTRPPENAGDSGPEALVFVEEDVYGTALLFGAFTESSSIVIYTVNCADSDECDIGSECDRTEDCCNGDVDEREYGITCSHFTKYSEGKSKSFCCMKHKETCSDDSECCGGQTKCIDSLCHNQKSQWLSFHEIYNALYEIYIKFKKKIKNK